MYKFKSRRNDLVRFVFPDGRQVNLLGRDAKFTRPQTAQQTETIIVIPGATDKDFEEILANPKYRALHTKIEKIEDKSKPVVAEEKKSVKPTKKKSVDVSTTTENTAKPDSK